MKDIRGAAKREREFYGRNPVMQCFVCRRWFIKRAAGEVCSMSCAERAKSNEQPGNEGQ